MPLIVRKFNAQVKDPKTGNMIPAGLLSSDSLEGIDAAKNAALTSIEDKKTSSEAAIETKGENTLAKIPDDYTELSNQVRDAKESINMVQNGFCELNSVIQGSFNDAGAVVENANRIRNEGFIQVYKGQAMHFIPGTTTAQMLYGTFTTEKRYVSDSAWLTTESTIIIPNDGYIIVVFAKSDKNTAITPSDFDATFEIYTQWKASNNELKTRLIGFETTFTAPRIGTYKFDINLYKNAEYTCTNNTTASVSVNVYDAEGNATSIHGGLGAGKSVTFIASDNYTQIGGYFNAAGTVTLASNGILNEIRNNSEEIEKNNLNINELENIIGGYSEEIAITTAQASKVYYTTIKKGVMYAIKNKTSGTVFINVYTADDVGKTITQSLSPNNIVKWVADNDYVRISAFCNNTGSLIFYHNNVYEDMFENLMKNDSWIQTISNGDSGAVSALTIINNKLYVFPYVQNNGNTTGKIFDIDIFGKLTDAGNTFTSNIGHQNTVDYSTYNHCLLASRYTMGDGITDFSVYIFENVTETTDAFDIDSAVKIDMSVIGGDTLNAIWATNNYGRNDMIYVFTRDNENNKQYYSLVQLGKGSNQLPNGTLISGVSGNAFNGTFKVLSTIEKSLVSGSGVLEYINDACLYNGKIYKCVVQAMGGFAYMTDRIVGFGNAIESKEFLIPQANQIGDRPSIESEGIAIRNGYLYIGSYGHGINVFKIT